MNFGLRLARSNMCSVNINSSNEYYSEKWDKVPLSFVFLSGEDVIHEGKTSEGTLTVTNYRIVLQHNETHFNIPLGVIDQTEIRKLSTLHILCKDARSYKCTFSTNELCLEWQKKIDDAIASPSDIEKVFAFKFYESLLLENTELHNFLTSHTNGLNYAAISNRLFEEELKRLKFDMGGTWRISSSNEDYRLCSSYPRKIIVPSSISDSNLEAVARFRSSRRIPAVVWRHPNGAIIARSSQPEVGWLGWRSSEDEDLIKALAEACAYDSPISSRETRTLKSSLSDSSGGGDSSQDLSFENKKDISMSSDVPSICDLPEAKSQEDIKKLLIVDARSYATAVANRARGGGCECPEYYPTCEIQFMNLDNIHCIRKSHQALRHLVSLPADIPNWLSLLENSRWLSHMSGLLKAAVTVAQTVAVEGRPVLVHCSDGWDRTPQITALAQILMDSHYRTFEGFQVLVEREWIEFGHKFGDRCGCGLGTEDCNERSPIFLQWLDCVYQLLEQFPTAFEFNQSYLVKLSQHVYSNLFGTFLFNSPQKRIQAELNGKYYSVWSLLRLNQQQYVNRLHTQTQQILFPSCHTKDLQLWKAAYMTKVERNIEEYSGTNNGDLYSKEDEMPMSERELTKTKSCDDLVALAASTPPPPLGRRSSDPNLRENSVPDMAMLKSAIGSETVDDSINQSGAENVYNCNNNSNEKKDKLKQNGEIEVHEKTTLVNGFVNKSEIVSFNGKLTLMLKNNKVDDLNHCNLELCRKSIEGSTDTLVSESGALGTGEESCEKPENQNGAIISTVKRKFQPREKLEETHSNLALKISSATKKLNDAFLNPEERYQDDLYNRAAFSIAECNSCYQSRKFLNDIRLMSSQLQDMIANDSELKHPPKGTRHSTPGHSRSPSSGIASTPNNERVCIGWPERSHSSNLQTIDGLSNFSDDISRKLEQIHYQHQAEVDILLRELRKVKLQNQQLTEIQNRLNHHNQENHLEDQVSLPESVGSGSGGSVGQESGVSDTSWEAVEEGEYKTTLWLPDHAADQCMGCNSSFWIGRRKHHCRSCGKIFCAECSNHNVPIPKENLHDPVRVCKICFTSLSDFKPKSVTVMSD